MKVNNLILFMAMLSLCWFIASINVGSGIGTVFAAFRTSSLFALSFENEGVKEK